MANEVSEETRRLVLSHFEDVAESMPPSAERGAAILNSLRCLALLEKFPEARRRLSLLESLPNIDWYVFREFEADSQFGQNIMRTYMNGDTRFISPEIAKDLDRLEHSDKFPTWRAELKKWQAKVKQP